MDAGTAPWPGRENQEEESPRTEPVAGGTNAVSQCEHESLFFWTRLGLKPDSLKNYGLWETGSLGNGPRDEFRIRNF